MVKKVSQRGKKTSSKILWLRDFVMSVAGSLLAPQRIHVFKFPVGRRRIGKVIYTVRSKHDPVSFTKRKDAEAYQKLLLNSLNFLESDIVRHEITEEGYELQ
jgi:hypothetical protein